MPSRTFVTCDSFGRRRFDVPGLSGIYAGSMLMMDWYPRGYSPLINGVRNGNTAVAITASIYLIREFSPELTEGQMTCPSPPASHPRDCKLPTLRAQVRFPLPAPENKRLRPLPQFPFFPNLRQTVLFSREASVLLVGVSFVSLVQTATSRGFIAGAISGRRQDQKRAKLQM